VLSSSTSAAEAGTWQTRSLAQSDVTSTCRMRQAVRSQAREQHHHDAQHQLHQIKCSEGFQNWTFLAWGLYPITLSLHFTLLSLTLYLYSSHLAMPRKYVIGGNWKCNGTVKSVAELVKDLNEAGPFPSNAEVRQRHPCSRGFSEYRLNNCSCSECRSSAARRFDFMIVSLLPSDLAACSLVLGRTRCCSPHLLLPCTFTQRCCT
jgi:hypothetical protein